MAVRDVVQAAAGVAGGGEYVEDVFSTYLYNGTQTAKTITNGIDLAGEGGMVWSKVRNNSGTHRLNDSVRGVSNGLRSDSTAADQTVSNGITAFNNNGYALGTDAGNSGYNFNNYTYASWSFRKAPKFFDVVTWTGNSTARTIAHSLGSVPGMIIVKRTDSTANWAVYHRGLTSANHSLLLNLTGAQDETGYFANTTPTDTVFSISSNSVVNASGGTYVAYLFAHDAGGFGDDGEQNIISCGSFSEPSTGNTTNVNLGFEPQWVIVKSASDGDNWHMIDVMRGFTANSSSNSQELVANGSNTEGGGTYISPTSTGFKAYPWAGNGGGTIIYIAIRRPMKTPESGTEVFNVQQDDAGGTTPAFVSGFPVDVAYSKNVAGTAVNFFGSRLQGANYLRTNDTTAETANTDFKYDYNNGWNSEPTQGASTLSYMFKRAPGFMDVVATPQTAAGYGTVTHNLGVAPEFIILKGRDYTESWRCYHAALGRGATIQLNVPDAQYLGADYWGAADPTATEFGAYWAYFSSPNYIAYLFATLDGVSKVGSYTGTGADLNVDCGFSAGARFILIKRTDSTGDWYVWDSVRGIVSGNDPYLLLNTTAAQVTNTDYIDPLSSGFTVTSSAPAALNASGGSYIFLAIA